MEERRNFPRIAVNKQASLFIENRLNSIPCVVEDISASGARLLLNKSLFPEVFSNINLVIPDSFDFNTGAHVAWHDETDGRNTYGLFFNRIDEGNRNKLSEYIRGDSLENSRKGWR